uniref:Uncharacterized protein LOC102806788 n=1 Tax=Saccoglossus kowalevskii TaxID=10224 RepID=A0ABM0MK56_SACKO|nr:PREDICTED: uncharacterized protein LOC102806788 [Saccoglossus kowalevskii]
MIKIRKPQIGRSHMEGFSFRPGIWKLLSGGLRTKMSHKCNHMLRQRQKEQKKKSSTVDTQTKEGAPGNTTEGTDQQPECLKHVGDADILEPLANPKLKRLVERKVTSKIPIDDRIDYRDSITGSNNHQRYCLHQRAEKCSIFQKPSRCCGARSPSLTNIINMSITVKAYLQTADDSQKIRRFAVDQGESTSYEYLSTKITQVFPSIGRSDSFTLSYRDTEGDLVAFSNDTELADVLGQLNEGILKVYIHPYGLSSVKHLPTAGRKHPILVTVSYRYKSTTDIKLYINMSITVKAYLQTADDSQEIRRFAVDQGASTSYEYLSTKITQVFPSIGRSDSFTLSYRDSEGDSITFSTDKELEDVVGQLSKYILKVYIRLTGKKYHKKVHYPRIMCDGCENRIVGPRFKCVVCPGYDLCKGCEEKGLHPDHEMIKIRKPQIGRSHMKRFSRPCIWRLLSGGFQHKVTPKCNNKWGQRQNILEETRPANDTPTEENVPENTTEGINPHPKCLKHVGDADILEPLANPKRKRLLQRKAVFKKPTDVRKNYGDSKTGENNHQRHRLNQPAGKCSTFQTSPRCCRDRSRSMINMSTQLKKFRQEQQIKRCRRRLSLRPFRGHKWNNQRILLKTAPFSDAELYKKFHPSQKVTMPMRNSTTMTKPSKPHRSVDPNMKSIPTCASDGKQVKRLHQSRRMWHNIGRCRSTGGKKFKRPDQAQPVRHHTRCSTMTKPFRDHQIKIQKMTPNPICVSSGKRFKRSHQVQQLKNLKERFSPVLGPFRSRVIRPVIPNQTCVSGGGQFRRFQQMHCPRRMAMFIAQNKHLSSNISPRMKHSKGFDVDVDHHGMRERFWMKQNRGHPCGRGPHGSNGIGCHRCQCYKAQREAQATAK